MEYIVNTREVANFLGLTQRRISQLAAEGVISKLENGKFNLKEISEQYYKFKYDMSDVAQDYETEKAKHEAIKRRLSEIKLARIEGTMHDAADIERVMTDMLTNCRSRLLSIPTKAAPILVGIEDIGNIEGILRQNIYEALNELANYEPGMFYGEDNIEPVD